jgi:thiosulfate dehydrogenase
MTIRRGLLVISACTLVAGAIYVPLRLYAAPPDPWPTHQLPPAQAGGTVVGLCDGKTSIEVPWLKPGQRMTEEQARGVTDALMAKWREQHPDAEWLMAQAQPRQPAANRPAAQLGQAAAPAPAAPGQGGIYARLTPREQMIADAETAKFIEQGKEIFHSADKLGGTVGISCDMCHPDGANTHPETYPKYQVQLQRVALLRDMINWCIENPVKGKPLSPDDPRLRALEAYIIAQRNGVPLAYGKH